mgnify:CR=1 FL=1
MRKVVFKGVINGKEFDNVQDYNAEMHRLIDAGERNISASSNSQIVDEKAVAEPEKVETVQEFDVQDYLPFFDGSHDGHYLDILISDDMKLNDETLSIMRSELDEKVKNLNYAIESDLVPSLDRKSVV